MMGYPENSVKTLVYEVRHVREAYNSEPREGINLTLNRLAREGWDIVSVSMVRDGAQPYYNGGSDKTYIVTMRRFE